MRANFAADPRFPAGSSERCPHSVTTACYPPCRIWDIICQPRLQTGPPSEALACLPLVRLSWRVDAGGGVFTLVRTHVGVTPPSLCDGVQDERPKAPGHRRAGHAVDGQGT